MRTPRPILFAAAALALAAACTDGAAGGPTIAGAPEPAPSLSPFFTTAPAPVEQDSVVGGYGNECTGGLDYTIFEYDPATGTEYVVCSDTVVTKRDTTLKPTTPTAP